MSTACKYCMKTNQIISVKKKLKKKPVLNITWTVNVQATKTFKFSLEKQNDEKKCVLAQISALQQLSFLSQASFYAWVNTTCGLRSCCTLFSQSISQGRSDHLSPLLLWLALPHSILPWQLHPLGFLFVSLHPLQHIQSRRKKRHKTSHILKKKKINHS